MGEDGGRLLAKKIKQKAVATAAAGESSTFSLNISQKMSIYINFCHGSFLLSPLLSSYPVYIGFEIPHPLAQSIS